MALTIDGQQIASKTNVLISTPNMGTLVTDFVSCLVSAISVLQHRGILWATFLPAGGVTAHGRNEAVNLVLTSPHNFTHVMFIDSDMTFPRDGILQLLGTGKQLIAGVYTKRSLKRELLVRMDGKPKKTVTEVHKIATGFMLIDRSVLVRMKEKYKCPFQYGEDENNITSEDFLFCDRWREMGGKVWAKWDIPIGHVGTYEYK